MHSHHPLFNYQLKQDKLYQDIRQLNEQIRDLERDTLKKLAKYKVGQQVKIRDTYLFVKSHRLDKSSESGVTYCLVSANKDGTMPEVGKVVHYCLDEEYIDYRNKIEWKI